MKTPTDAQIASAGRDASVEAARDAYWGMMLRGEKYARLASIVRAVFRPYLLVALMALIAKAPTLTNWFLEQDEGYYLFQGQKLDSLYAFAYSFKFNPEYKPPLGLLPYIAAASISHEHALLLLHLFAFIAVLLSVLLMVLISKTALESHLPGLIASFLWLFYLNRDGATAAAKFEYFQLPFLLGATWLFLRGRQRRSGTRRFLAIAGLCIGVATLVKPPGLMMAPTLSVAILATWPGAVRHRLMQAGTLCLASIAPILAWFIPYLMDPEALVAIRSGFLEPVSGYVMAVPLEIRVARLVIYSPAQALLSIVVVGASVAHMARRAIWGIVPVRWNNVSSRASSLEATSARTNGWLLLLLGWSLLLGYLSGAGFSQHLIPVIPFTSLFLARWFLDSYGKLRPGWGRRLFVLLVTSLVILPEATAAGYYARSFGDDGTMYMSEMKGVDARELVDFVKAESRPGDPVWVYFAAPEVYWLADRSPSTDDPMGATVAMNDPAKLRRSIERDRPVLIVDIGEPRLTPYSNAPRLESVPFVNDLLAEEYQRQDGAVPGTTVYKRKALISGANQ